jgi:hypothetical protein
MVEKLTLQAAVVSGPFPCLLTTNWDCGLEAAWEALPWMEKCAQAGVLVRLSWKHHTEWASG